MGKFREYMTELSARHTIKAGDYSLTFLFCSLQITSMGTELSLYLTIKINLSICPISLPSSLHLSNFTAIILAVFIFFFH